jgi:uncharacterized protein
MPSYFADTWFLIASLNPTDAAHHAALRIARTLRGAEFVTHDGVLTELLTFFSGHGSFWRRSVTSFVRDALASSQYKVVPFTRDLFDEALTLYDQRPDKEYSLVDCASMRLMLRRGITHVLTNDHHFRQEGFTVVSE